MTSRNDRDAKTAYLQALARQFPQEAEDKLLAIFKDAFGRGFRLQTGRGIIKAARSGIDVLTATVDDVLRSTFPTGTGTRTGRRPATTQQLQGVVRLVEQRISGNYQKLVTHAVTKGTASHDFRVIANGRVIKQGRIQIRVNHASALRQGAISNEALEGRLRSAFIGAVRQELRQAGLTKVGDSPNVDVELSNFQADIEYEVRGDAGAKLGDG